MSKKVYIYSLENKNNIFYIGKTNNTSRRRSIHRKNYGYEIELFIIDEVLENEWKFWECYWIQQFKAWGFELTNLNNGGGGPTQWTEEQKFLINPNRIAKIKNHKTRGFNISKTLLNNDHSKYYTQDIKDKMSKKLKGISKTFTEEHKINLAKSNLESKGKIVECYDLNGIFQKDFMCLREAKDWLIKEKFLSSPNVDKQIKDCCNNRQKTCHGYKFKYK